MKCEGALKVSHYRHHHHEPGAGFFSFPTLRFSVILPSCDFTLCPGHIPGTDLSLVATEKGRVGFAVVCIKRPGRGGPSSCRYHSCELDVKLDQQQQQQQQQAHLQHSIRQSDNLHHDLTCLLLLLVAGHALAAKSGKFTGQVD